MRRRSARDVAEVEEFALELSDATDPNVHAPELVTTHDASDERAPIVQANGDHRVAEPEGAFAPKIEPAHLSLRTDSPESGNRHRVEVAR